MISLAGRPSLAPPRTPSAPSALAVLFAIAMTALALLACEVAPNPDPPMPSFPGSRGATSWIEDSVEIPRGFRDGEGDFSSADQLIESFVNEIQAFGGPESTVRARGGVLGTPSDTEAQGYVHFMASGDDSVAGSEHRLNLRRGDSGWFIESIDQRMHCRRGLSAESDACL